VRDQLAAVVGAEHVLTDPDLTRSYETDWTGRFTGTSACVVRPGTTAEVAEVLRLCSAAGTTVVVQGGNTGLVGGGVPAGGEVVLSLTRLTDVGEVDVAAAQVTVGAGVTLADLQALARAHDLEFGVDLAARESATVGGLVATMFGHFPQPGESIDYRGFTVEVVDAESKRVNRVRFRRKPAEAQAQ